MSGKYAKKEEPASDQAPFIDKDSEARDVSPGRDSAMSTHVNKHDWIATPLFNQISQGQDLYESMHNSELELNFRSEISAEKTEVEAKVERYG